MSTNAEAWTSPDESHETIDPGVGFSISMVRKTRKEVADDDTVMVSIDPGASHNAIRVVRVARQVFEASMVKFVQIRAQVWRPFQCLDQPTIRAMDSCRIPRAPYSPFPAGDYQQ